MKLHYICWLVLLLSITACQKKEKVVWLDELETQFIYEKWGETHKNASILGNPISIAGKIYNRGVGTHALSICVIQLDGEAVGFNSYVGVDDEEHERGSAVFYVIGDNQIIWSSGTLNAGKAKNVNVKLENINKLVLVTTDAGDGNGCDHTNWANAQITYKGDKPQIIPELLKNKQLFAGNKNTAEPIIYASGVLQASVNQQLRFKIPALGKKPITYSIPNCPQEVKINAATGEIVAKCFEPKEIRIRVEVENEYGKDYKEILLKITPRNEQ